MGESDSILTPSHGNIGISRGGMTGAAAEAVFDALCHLNHWATAIPIVPSPYDRIIDRGHGLERVQVKSMGAGGQVALLKGYHRDSFDHIAAVQLETGAVWLIPWRYVGMSSLTINGRFDEHQLWSRWNTPAREPETPRLIMGCDVKARLASGPPRCMVQV